MCSEDFRPPSYMAKPSSWVPGSLTQVAEGQVAIFLRQELTVVQLGLQAVGFLSQPPE